MVHKCVSEEDCVELVLSSTLHRFWDQTQVITRLGSRHLAPWAQRCRISEAPGNRLTALEQGLSRPTASARLIPQSHHCLLYVRHYQYINIFDIALLMVTQTWFLPPYSYVAFLLSSLFILFVHLSTDKFHNEFFLNVFSFFMCFVCIYICISHARWAHKGQKRASDTPRTEITVSAFNHLPPQIWVVFMVTGWLCSLLARTLTTLTVSRMDCQVTQDPSSAFVLGITLKEEKY